MCNLGSVGLPTKNWASIFHSSNLQTIKRPKLLETVRNGKTSTFLNPFLSAHIPYAQSEGILPKYGLLQWVEYISKSTQWISTKLCRDMVEALSFQKTLKYWWPLTYIQGHVIQDGRQIHFSKSNFGLKLPITQPIFGQIE